MTDGTDQCVPRRDADENTRDRRNELDAGEARDHLLRCDVILAMLRTHQPTRPAPSLPEAA